MTAEENWSEPVGVSEDAGTYKADEAATTRAPRHPCHLTATRLVDHIDKYGDHLTPAELSAINLSVLALTQVPAREAAARRAGVDRG